MRIKLCGDVCSNDDADLYRYFGYEVCCPTDVRDAIGKCTAGEELVIELNSPGGSVYAGFEMYTLLRGYKGKTVAEVYGIAASAASVILAACDDVRMSPVGQVMIHRANAIAVGNSGDMAEVKQMLDSVDRSILNAYVEKCGDKTSRETLARMMQNETFLTAQDAIDCGLADSMLDAPDKIGAGPFALAVASAGGNVPFLIPSALPPTADLLHIRAQLNSNKATLDADAGVNPGKPVAVEASIKSPEVTGSNGGGVLMTIKELRAQYPEQIAQVEAEAKASVDTAAAADAAVSAERERLAAIDEVAGLFDPALVAEAKYGVEACTAAELALRAAQKAAKAGSKFLADQQMDAQESGAGAVGAAPPATEDVKNSIEQARADARAYNASRKEMR